MVMLNKRTKGYVRSTKSGFKSLPANFYSQHHSKLHGLCTFWKGFAIAGPVSQRVGSRGVRWAQADPSSLSESVPLLPITLRFFYGFLNFGYDSSHLNDPDPCENRSITSSATDHWLSDTYMCCKHQYPT